ncbi:MAG: DUF4124 domain-containing protein [Gammaproteobacteria bacterium]|nr:DUF4124 domain-containing protein [Gammaproteobacteria bacterium]
MRIRRSFDVVGRGLITALFVVLASAGTALPAQEVYRSVDADGHVVYSDRGATKGAPKTTLHVNEADPAEAARLSHEQALLSADDAARTRQQALDEKNRAAQVHKKQQACDKARDDYGQMTAASRLYRRDTSGNRVYYSDDEADAMRERARHAMVAACGA